MLAIISQEQILANFALKLMEIAKLAALQCVHTVLWDTF